MALSFSLSAVPVSGTNVEVFDRPVGGVPSLRLAVENLAGSAALTAATVQHRAASGGILAVIDETTFATLGPGQSAQILIDGPVENLRMIVSTPAGSGTQLKVEATSPVIRG